MANNPLKLLADKKETVETFMEILEKGAEVLAESVGEMFPLFSIAAPIVKLALDNVESKEAEFMREQFQKVRDRLEIVSEEIQRITQEIKKSGVDATYFSVEENLTNQFRKYMDILNAKPKFREVKKKLFLEHFSKTGGDKNLHTLYAAVTGDNFSSESVLEVTLNYEEKSRRAMEDFCARLKNLFCVGLIALLGHAALKECGEEEELLRDWGEKIRKVEEKMKAIVEDCKTNFACQAELDVRKRLKLWKDRTHTDLADATVQFLKRKYDWVFWSVRVYGHSRGWFERQIVGKKYQAISGGSHFALESEPRLVVSYSLKSDSLDKHCLKSLIEGQKYTKDMEKLSQKLHGGQPHCQVHAIRKHVNVAESSSFPDDSRYYQLHGKAHIYIYSD